MKTWFADTIIGSDSALTKELNAFEEDGWTIFTVAPQDHPHARLAWTVVMHKEERPKPTRPPFFCGDELIWRGAQQVTPFRVIGVNGNLDGVLSYVLENSDGVRTPHMEASLVHSMWSLAPKETR